MSFLTEQEQDQITGAIAEVEHLTSGEIRVAVEKHCKGEPFERAAGFFDKLGMNKTVMHHGVLIYIAYQDKKFAILGDKGINQIVPPDFWDTTHVAMKAHFAAGNFAGGLLAGIKLAGEVLAAHFPQRNGDINELPNDIIFLDQRDQIKHK